MWGHPPRYRLHHRTESHSKNLGSFEKVQDPLPRSSSALASVSPVHLLCAVSLATQRHTCVFPHEHPPPSPPCLAPYPLLMSPILNDVTSPRSSCRNRSGRPRARFEISYPSIVRACSSPAGPSQSPSINAAIAGISAEACPARKEHRVLHVAEVLVEGRGRGPDRSRDVHDAQVAQALPSQQLGRRFEQLLARVARARAELASAEIDHAHVGSGRHERARNACRRV